MTEQLSTQINNNNNSNSNGGGRTPWEVMDTFIAVMAVTVSQGYTYPPTR